MTEKQGECPECGSSDLEETWYGEYTCNCCETITDKEDLD